MKSLAVALAATGLAATTAFAQQQGVTKDEIVIGTIQDLSGPIAAFGKQTRGGMVLRVDEINEQGGINGRKIKLIVEDAAYDPKRAVLAAQKLVNQDKIFMMLAHIGTAPNLAAMPVQFEKNIINFMPVTAAREMYEPFHRLKYSFAVPYYDQIRVMLPRLVKEKSAKKVCTIYQDDEFGLEVMRGAEAGLKAVSMELAEKTTYKRGATDFSSQVARMKAADCDLVVLGTIIRETIGTIGESRKSGFNPTFLGSSAAYTDLIHKLGGAAMNGLYASMGAQHPYLDEASQPIRFWANKYKTKLSEDPTVFSVYGYYIVDAFARAATKAGANLSTDSFIKAMDTMVIPMDMFGSAEASYGPKKRLGSDASRLSQIQDGKWKVISDYATP
jgi:branched-chain amino acid transport system substrate-binding protein